MKTKINLNNYPFIKNINNEKSLSSNDDSSFIDKETKISICKLDNRINENYDNSILFDDEEDKKNFFNSLDKIEIKTNWNFKNNNLLLIDINYLELLNFNYAMVDIYIPNSENRKTLFFFIKNMVSINHQTTKIEIELDVFTTFIDKSITIKKTNLIKGHLPEILSIDVDTFLADPINNNHFILDKEDFIDNTGKNIVPKSYFYPFNKNKIYVCVATSNDWQKTINQISPNHNTNIPSGYHYYAIDGSNWNNFINKLENSELSFLKSGIKYIYILDDSFLDLGNKFTLNDEEVIILKHNTSNDGVVVGTYELDKNDFNINSNYTKLYTSLFTQIEITDLQNNVVTVNIEDIAGRIDIINKTLTHAPFVKMKTFINGVGGNTSSIYTISKLHSTGEVKMYDNMDIVFDYEIPTYSIFQSNKVKYNNENSLLNENRKNQNQTTYDNSTLSNDNTLLNNTDTYNNTLNNNFIISNKNRYIAQVQNNHMTNAIEESISTNKQISTINHRINGSNAYFSDQVQRVNVEEKTAFMFEKTIVNTGVMGVSTIDPMGGMSLMTGVASTVGSVITNMAAIDTARDIYDRVRHIHYLSNRNNMYADMLINGANDDWHLQIEDEPEINIPAENGLINTNLSHQKNIRNSLNTDVAEQHASALETTATNSTNVNINNSNRTHTNKNTQNLNTLTQANENIDTYIEQQKTIPPIKYGFESNFDNAINDSYGIAGIKINIKKAPENIIKKAIEHFNKYGYTYNGIFENVELLHPSKNFQYWEVKDIIFDNLYISNSINKKLQDIFKKGITLWEKEQITKKIEKID